MFLCCQLSNFTVLIMLLMDRYVAMARFVLKVSNQNIRRCFSCELTLFNLERTGFVSCSLYEYECLTFGMHNILLWVWDCSFQSGFFLDVRTVAINVVRSKILWGGGLRHNEFIAWPT